MDGGSGSNGTVMQGSFNYRHSGLQVASQIELPEWAAFARAEGPADVRIILSDEPCPDCPSDGSVAVGESLRFAIKGIGGWQVEGGHTIRLHPGLTADLPELRLFTLGSAWGALGYQRGFAMWHGSAVEMAGRTVLLCGDAGAGKSTMAAALCARGARLLADDLSRIEPGEEGARIYPSSARLKLGSEAIERFGWQDAVLQRDYFRDEKFHCAAPQHRAGERAQELHAIISLEESDGLDLTRLNGAEALETAMRETMYRPEMLDALGAWGHQGGLAAQIVAQCPVYRMRRPKDFTALDEVCALIETLQDR
ncbi:HPr kinase/phosphorylase [Erythrobacter sp. SD-21]|uniref:HPr kinase/phosphorylase n=1 Tax=Erythrobacter sp. SD-21 TaxID=161528 RepID=UPI000153F0AA|nr:hypothetical protein [Erythrobacter sp. SD-21]EDL48944.1 hypothetical protein ED21_24476 [Erythrobacter sp. SD-21]